jgi:hypothetical protein
MVFTVKKTTQLWQFRKLLGRYSKYLALLQSLKDGI